MSYEMYHTPQTELAFSLVFFSLTVAVCDRATLTLEARHSNIKEGANKAGTVLTSPGIPRNKQATQLHE